MKKLFILFTLILFIITCGKDKDNIKDGYFSYPYENGQLHMEGNHKNGKKDGKWTIYFENGQIDNIQHYKNGKKNGTTKVWDENGKLTFQGNFVDGNEVIK